MSHLTFPPHPSPPHALQRMLRAIRFDNSDDHVFDRTAMPDEWVVSGAVIFSGFSPDELSALRGKPRQAFANGFLGADSLGWSTFATVGEVTPAEVEAVVTALSRRFMDELGAPGEDAALQAARHEVDFVLDLVSQAPINTVFTVRRTVGEDGDINEEFRTIKPPTGEPAHARIWSVVPDETAMDTKPAGENPQKHGQTGIEGEPNGADNHS